MVGGFDFWGGTARRVALLQQACPGRHKGGERCWLPFEMRLPSCSHQFLRMVCTFLLVTHFMCDSCRGSGRASIVLAQAHSIHGEIATAW